VHRGGRHPRRAHRALRLPLPVPGRERLGLRRRGPGDRARGARPRPVDARPRGAPLRVLGRVPVRVRARAMSESDLGPLFRLPDDPHYLWIAGVVVAALAIAVLAIGLVRGRLPSNLLLPALGLPLVAWGIGYLHTLEESKQVTFCGSCHETMSPLVAALSEDDDTIASAHFRRGRVPAATACYECHSGYGLWGGVDAKLAGLRHMLLTVTGGY